jgi:hypothetical protein
MMHFAILYHIKEVLFYSFFAKSFYKNFEWVLNFAKCLFYIYWDVGCDFLLLLLRWDMVATFFS